MLKPRILILLALLVSFASSAQSVYQRDQALPVEKVVYGEIESRRLISQTELIEDSHQGWRTFGGALLGGVIGHQFGGGSGQDVATVLGALLGGGIANQQSQARTIQHQLLELMIKQDDGQQVLVIQTPDPSMPLAAGDRVRVIYFPSSVRVDIAM
ncbi:glycine zipper 2TM domain-containing protein [Shewanella sp. NIFS-20-20]|uniref:glycine zipper 2TM domain-containing protein n=1 Tax=Shewanella sp. NIFS-20-20 TaxID=2853806 RepID=UPI001C4697A8|nr:glycine zipper 2TM domain-containing protein [Shewanella sp. NIFS-20-20]MBV7314586.1 glycine zipper 2TM domain-containing protein [Shewanella sp. NIFS-20-20]